MLTHKQIENAQPKAAPYKLHDSGGGLGLYVLVNPSGSKLWRVRYSRHGRLQFLFRL
jgi:hypothetical protein